MITLSLALLAMVGESPRNILFVLQDDGGYNGLGYMNERLHPGKPKLHTPRLDALAADAVKLTQFYVLPLCSPTRSAFLTGRYPVRLGTQAINPDWGKPWGLDLGERFIGQSLQAAGMTTALFGKWHVGMHTNGSLPNARGFDEYEGFLTGGLTHFTHSTAVYSYPPSKAFPRGCNKCVVGYDWHRQRNGVLELALDRNMTYSSHAVRDATVDFIRRQYLRQDGGGNGKPWFVYAAFQTVHEPLEVPDEYRAPYNDSTRKPFVPNVKIQTYCAMATALDSAVGAIVDAIEGIGALRETLIVFTSDNGAMAHGTTITGGMTANQPLSGGKTLTTEGGTRVPCFWYFPKLLKPRWSKLLGHVTDLHPTFVALVGGSTALSRPLDGLDLWPAVLSEDTPSPRTEMLYNLNPREDNDDQLHCPKASIRRGELKLSLSYWHNATVTDATLFNLTADIGEQHDLAKEKPAVVASLFARLAHFAAEAVPPYEPWAPWQGANYKCCDCSESWGTERDGVKTWEPWLSDSHEAPSGGCRAPFPACEVPPCYGH